MDDKGFKLSKKAKVKLQDKEWLKKQLEKGKSPQELLEFSDEAMADCYAVAYKLFEEHRYVEARNAFLFLMTLNSFHHDYWLGLGMSTQLLGDYEAAIDAYEMAAICKLESPVSYFYLAKCLFAIHDRESSVQALDLAIEYSGDDFHFADLKAQAELARELLLKDFN